MIFTSPRANVTNTTDISICGQTVDKVDSTRFLGVLLDNKLNFRDHITHIRKKVARGIYIPGRARHFFDELTIKDLYYAFIHPYFYYCNEIWGNTCSTYLDPLIKLQKRAIRIIAGVPGRSHTYELFQRFMIVRLDNLYKYNVYMFLYKLMNNQLPPGVRSSYMFNSEVHNHSTRFSQSQGLRMSTMTGGLKNRGFRHQTALLQAERPDIDYNVPIASFKYCLKTSLLCTEE